MIRKETQFSVFMINKPGVLQPVCQELGQAKVNIVALAMMDSMEHGVLRLVTEEAGQAREVLKKLEVPRSETDVLLVPMPNAPGAMAMICDELARAKCKVSYAYITTGSPGGKTIGVFKVANPDRAISTLSTPRDKRGRKHQARPTRTGWRG
jgi:hypothetical protein